MAEEKTPILVVESGETTTDQDGTKPARLYFQLSWGTDRQPFGNAKAMIYTVRYPGSRESLDIILRVYGEDGSTVIERHDRDKGKVRDIADLFEKNAERIETGTPIGVLNLDPARVATLKEKGILTVEALRDVPESNIGDLGIGGRAMQQRAVAFLDGKDNFAAVAELQAKNEGLQQTLDAQRDEFNALKAEMGDLRRQMAAATAPARGKGTAGQPPVSQPQAAG